MKRVSIIGLGLIGSSIARGLKGKYHVTGYNKTLETTKKAKNNDVIDEVADSLPRATHNADIVIICTPLGTYEEIATELSDCLEPGTIVTDVGSVKTHAVFSIYRHMPPGVEFVPAHPIAGKEWKGYDFGDGELFVGKKVVVTPLPKNRSEAILEVENMWKSLGAVTEQMTPAEHDKVYALVSHVPQLLAYAYKMAITHKKYGLSELPQTENFEKFMRISNSDPKIWAEIFMYNGTNISKFLEKMFNGLVHIDKFTCLIETREKLGGKEFEPQFTSDKKFDAAGTVFPTLLGNLLLVAVEDEMENNLSRSFSAADIHESLAMLEQEIGGQLDPKDFSEYVGSGFVDFTTYSLCDVSDHVEKYTDEVQLLKALVHRKIFEITAAMESDSVEHLASKLAEAGADQEPPTLH